MKCQHQGCEHSFVVECYRKELLDYGEHYLNLSSSERKQLLKNLLEYYCPEHCQIHGYCWNCGNPLPDRENGFCEHCQGEDY